MFTAAHELVGHKEIDPKGVVDAAALGVVGEKMVHIVSADQIRIRCPKRLGPRDAP